MRCAIRRLNAERSFQDIKVATDLNGDVANALFGYRDEPLAAFRYKSAEQFVSEGRKDGSLQYVQSLCAGLSDRTLARRSYGTVQTAPGRFLGPANAALEWLVHASVAGSAACSLPTCE